MNREQRRKSAKEQRRPNSKRNFANSEIVDLPLSEIQDNEDLKDCDLEVLDLMAKRMDWAAQTNMEIIKKGIEASKTSLFDDSLDFLGAFDEPKAKVQEKEESSYDILSEFI